MYSVYNDLVLLWFPHRPRDHMDGSVGVSYIFFFLRIQE